MRASQADKAKSRERIVASAARLMRERGLDGASVNDVMRDAGLTHGGFYRHFPDKDGLAAAAITAAFDAFIEAPHDILGAKGAKTFTDVYLSELHVDNPSHGCPIPALAADVARASAPLKAAFGDGISRIAARLAAERPGEDADTAALQHLAMLVGAVLIARASDAKTAARVLAAVRDAPR